MTVAGAAVAGAGAAPALASTAPAQAVSRDKTAPGVVRTGFERFAAGGFREVREKYLLYS